MPSKKEVKDEKSPIKVKAEALDGEMPESQLPVGQPPIRVKAEVLNGEMPKSQLPVGQPRKETFSLHIKGPRWIKDRENSESELKKMNVRITKVRHPRQKGADYVFVDFASAEERDEAYKELLPLEGVCVQLARKDNAELVEKRKAKVQAKREAKKQLKALRRNIEKNERREKHSAKQKKLSNQIVIMNLPKVTTKVELNEHFENFVDAKLNLDKNPKRKFSKAILTLATPTEALNASKKAITLHGVALKIQLHRNVDEVIKTKKLEKAKKRKLSESDKKGTKKRSDEPKSKKSRLPEKPVAEKKAVKAAKSTKAAPEKPTAEKKAVKVTKSSKAVPEKPIAEKKAKVAKSTKASHVSSEVKKPLAKSTKHKKASPAKKSVKAEKE